MVHLQRKWMLREGIWTAVLLIFAFGLVVAPQKAMEGASHGLTLCATVIVPSLFPFLILSGMIVELGMAARLGKVLEPIMRPLFRVNGNCACALVLGLIGGYPVGARTALTLYQNGLCSRNEAQRLLAFCNNSGPAFVLGVLGAGIFANAQAGLLLYVVHVLAAVCVGLVFRFVGDGKQKFTRHTPTSIHAVRFSGALTSTVAASMQSVLGVCSFVVLFAVILSLLNHFGVLGFLAKGIYPFGMGEQSATQLLTGLLELSSGAWSLAGEGGWNGRLILASAMLGWGGLSVHCQVLSFFSQSELSTNTYWVGKALHALFSAGLTVLALQIVPISVSVAGAVGESVVVLGGWNVSTVLIGSVMAALLTGIFMWKIGGFRLKKRDGKERKNVV